MRIALLVLWGITGWCATLLLLRLRLPPPPLDTPEEPPPRPNWLLRRVIGVVGGVVGGLVFTAAFGPRPEPWIIFKPQPVPWVTAGPSPEPWMLLVAAATTVGAFLGASLLVDLYDLARGRGEVARH
jgi:hypothetical protein